MQISSSSEKAFYTFFFVRTKFIRTEGFKTPKIKNILRTCLRLQGKIKVGIKKKNIESQMYSLFLKIKKKLKTNILVLQAYSTLQYVFG